MSDPMPVVVVTREIPGETLQIRGAEVRGLPREAPDRKALLGMVRGASVVVTMFSDAVDSAFLDAAGPGLRGVCNFAVGVNNIDLGACRERGVVVTITPDAVTEGTANMAFGLMLAVARRIVEGDRFVRSGAWEERAPLSMGEMLGIDLAGRTLHIVGAGRIGYAVALRAVAFGMRVLYTARTRKMGFELAPVCAERVELDAGLARADVLSLHTPLTEETKHLIDARRIGLLSRDAIVINTARGPVVDESALAEALAAGRLFGAGLDVFEAEPRVHSGLLGLGNVVMTPHIGSGERRWRLEMSRMCAANAAAILAGHEPPNRVC